MEILKLNDMIIKKSIEKYLRSIETSIEDDFRIYLNIETNIFLTNTVNIFKTKKEMENSFNKLVNFFKNENSFILPNKLYIHNINELFGVIFNEEDILLIFINNKDKPFLIEYTINLSKDTYNFIKLLKERSDIMKKGLLINDEYYLSDEIIDNIEVMTMYKIYNKYQIELFINHPRTYNEELILKFHDEEEAKKIFDLLASKNKTDRSGITENIFVKNTDKLLCISNFDNTYFEVIFNTKLIPSIEFNINDEKIKKSLHEQFIKLIK